MELLPNIRRNTFPYYKFYTGWAILMFFSHLRWVLGWGLVRREQSACFVVAGFRGSEVSTYCTASSSWGGGVASWFGSTRSEKVFLRFLTITGVLLLLDHHTAASRTWEILRRITFCMSSRAVLFPRFLCNANINSCKVFIDCKFLLGQADCRVLYIAFWMQSMQSVRCVSWPHFL